VVSGGCCWEGGVRRESEAENETYLFLELWVSSNKFIIDIAGQISEARDWKGSKLLASLVSLWMKFIADREKGD